MSWYFLWGILFLIALVLFVYYYRKELWKLQEGFQTLEQVVMCNLPQNANSTTCALPDDPAKLPVETAEEIDIYDRYEKKNVPPPPPFKPTFIKKYSETFNDAPGSNIPWDYDNRDMNPNDGLWGFVHPICSQEIHLKAKELEVFGSINNFNFDQSGKLITYKIPLYNNLQVSGEENIKLFKFAEFLTNFAVGAVVEIAWDKSVGRIGNKITNSLWDTAFGGGRWQSREALENKRSNQRLKTSSKTASRGVLTNSIGLLRGGPKALVKSSKVLLSKLAVKVGIRVAQKVATKAATRSIMLAAGPPGWVLFAIDMIWTLAVVIIIPVLMGEYIPADGRCPPGFPINLEEAIVKNLGGKKDGQVAYEILTNIPMWGDLLAALAPYLCFNDKLESKPKINYELPQYYYDSSLSIYASNLKPMVPPSDPAFNDYRQYYEIEGYDYNIIEGSTSISDYLDSLKNAANLNDVTKKAPPIFVDFTHEEMLNKMAEYYYKTSRRLPYTNYDGSLSFEYITKIYGVVASTQYTCDIQCEITRDIIYPNTGVLKSRIIVPPDKMGNTYHDRRFYFFVDINDDLHNEIINDNRITYLYKSATSNKAALNLPIRNNSLYGNSATNWDNLMADNRARYIITGCTSINYTAPAASDSLQSGYVGDIIVAVANPGSIYFNPTLSINFDNTDKIPKDDSCNFARSRNINSKTDAIPMQSVSKKTDNSNVATLYDGTFFGKNLCNPGMTILQLTLKNIGNQLTFTEIIDNKLILEYTLIKDDSRTLQSDLQRVLNIGLLIRVRAVSNNQYISFDATIDMVNLSSITLTNIKNIKGTEMFNLNGTATTLTDGILLYSQSWGSNTKQWKYTKGSRTYNKDLSIVQSIGFATIAQAPGLGLGYQFVGGMAVTALEIGGVTNMMACTYQDMKQEGTYVINGNIISSSTTYGDDATRMGGAAEYNYFLNRGPTIIFSPGYVPNIFRGVDKCRGLALTQNDCINRYNIRLAVNKYQSYNINKRIKLISNIETRPANKMCVYSVTTTEYDRYTGLDTQNTNKDESLTMNYIINTDTCTFVASNIAFTTPPSSTDPIIPSDMYNRVMRNTILPATNLKYNIYKTNQCNIYPDTTYRCASYKIRAPIFNQLNNKYGGNVIDPDTIGKVQIGSVNIVQNAPINSQTTISQTSAFSLDYQVLLFENPTTKYRFEAMHRNINGNNIIVQNIDIIYPLVESVSTFITASGSENNITINGDVPSWLQRGVRIQLSNTALVSYNRIVENVNANNITLDSSLPSSTYKLSMSFNLNMNVIDFTIINANWLKDGININITLDDNTSFNADVLSYVDNIAQITPSVRQNITKYTNAITLRYNYKATNIYDKKYVYNSSSKIHISNGAIVFPGNKPDWLQTDSYVKILLDNNAILYGRVQNPNPGTISVISSDMGSYYTRNIVIMGNTLNKTIVQIPKESRLLVNKSILVTNIQSISSPQEIQITSIDLITNVSFLEGVMTITSDVPLWLKIGIKIEIYSNPAGILVATGKIINLNDKTITLDPLPSSITNGSYKINISDQTILTLNGNINSNSEQILFRLKDNEWAGLYNVYTIQAYGTNDTDVQNIKCTYNTAVNIPSQPITDSFSLIITPNDNNNCLYDIIDDSIPSKVYYPIVPRPGNYIELPAPIPSYVYLPAITGCDGTSYRDCSGIDIITRLVDKYNSTHPDSKILKVLRAYSLTNECEYQVEISRKIPYSRDRMIKKEALRFNMVPNQCKYEYTGEPIKGAILMIEPDPYSGTPDTFAMNPPYIWSTSLIDRYRRFVNQAISMYQSMTPTWSSILDNTSQTAENRMKGIFNEIYSNRTLGNCSQLTCRDNDTLTKYVKQYNFDNYPSYTAEEQYGYMQRSIIQIRRGGLGGTLTQCHVELIEKQDYYEDYTLPPVQSDDPNKARFNTKYFLRQYQYDLQIANCAVTGIVALTKDDINKNLMDISSNPFGIQSDVSIVQFTPQSDMDLFNLGEFYSSTFLNSIARIYSDRVINPTAPDKKNSITYFKNAFIISPTICEYQVVIKRNIYSDEYGIWVPTDGIDGYIWVETELPRVVISANIGEIYLMDVNFIQEGDTYVPRDSSGNILKMPYMFYADLTNTTSRVVGLPLPANGIPGLPNISSNGYRPT